MTTDEIKKRIDGLTPDTKTWLHHACNQIADAGEYIDQPAAHAECESAGLVETREENHMEVADGVMALVYGNNYLRSHALSAP